MRMVVASRIRPSLLVASCCFKPNRRFWRSRHLERLGKTGGGRRRQRRERRKQRRSSSSSSSRRRQSKRSSAQDSKLPAWRTTETARCPPEPSNALEVCSAQELPFKMTKHNMPLTLLYSMQQCKILSSFAASNHGFGNFC